MELIGRLDECRRLAETLSAVRAGQSRVLVISGDAGIGKTALLDEAERQAAEYRVIRVTGAESEVEFAFAALHRVCAAVSDHLAVIPSPQREALQTAFGERAGPTPDPFLVGLAVLGLLADAAHDRPLVVLVDDQQWLDQGSRRVLAFVARRLAAECVAMMFATRSVGEELRGFARLSVHGLPDDDSRELLTRFLGEPLDRQVRDRIIAESHGNPLALLELPRALGRAELAGGFGPPDAPRSHSLEGVYRSQLEALPLPTRRLLALAAADPAGNPVLLWQAAARLGLDSTAAMPAIEAGLAEIGHRVTFRHPLIRATAYRCVPLSERQLIHGALADLIDPASDPDRRAWHLGHAAVGPDQAVADELARCADRVQARGGISAAAVFMERASMLAVDPSRRCDLAIAAAGAKARAGILDGARDMLEVAEALPLNDVQLAQVGLVRADLALLSSHGNDAAPLLLGAARRLETIDPALARDAYLDAMSAAIFAGRLAVDGGGMLDVLDAAAASACVTDTPDAAALLLAGLATQYRSGFSAGLSTVRHALDGYGRGMTADRELRWMLVAARAAARIWDLERLAGLAARYVELARNHGAVSHLPVALSSLFLPLLFRGEFVRAADVAEEMSAVIEATGRTLTPYCAIPLAAWQGRHEDLAMLVETAHRDARRRGEGHGLTVIAWANSVAANSRCDYQAARDAAEYATSYRGDGGPSWWALAELVESTSRLGQTAAATAALARLTALTTPSATDWSLGIEARSRALVSDGDAAELSYREGLDRFTRAGLLPDLGRTHLLYGEWLRRQRRRVDARAHLGAAHELFDSIGMAAFSERARRELMATGERARRRSSTQVQRQLTAQEAQIARLARDGLTNPEIGARLFISARTVQYHLAKVFTKLGIHSRSQLETALADT